ncbi:hypothetical protein GCM10027049_21850 [Mucilaginibacter puniceus]
MALIGSIYPANIYTEYPEPGVEAVYADMHLSILDSTTGQPANGNNAIVDYQQNVSGTITNLQQAVPGQSMLIYSGLISRRRTYEMGNTEVEYYVTFTVTNVGDPNPSAPVNICNLTINRINIDAPESAPGANDAQITVVASSSYPIQYSLNNVTFQSSQTFSALSGGLKTVYVIDDNPTGCAANMPVTIPVISRTLISDPTVAIGNNKSRWNAAFNPIVFTYQRKDFAVTAVTLDSATNNAKVAVDTSFTDSIKDKTVYINAAPYKGAYTVKSYTGNTLVIDTPYVSDASGYININQLKQYYKVLTRITYQDPITGQQNNITSTNRPDNTGLVKADLSNFLQSLLRAKDDSNYTQINYRDTNLSASYQIEYAEAWSNGTTDHQTDWVTIAEPYYIVYAAKQLGDKHGGNLAAYVPFKTIANGTPLAKWITDFAEPVYSNDYPFDLSFIYGEDLAGLELYAKISLLDINKDSVGGLSPVYLINEDGSFLLNQDSSKLIIEDAPSVNTALAQRIGLNRFLIDHNFDDDVYYFTTGIYCQYGGEPSTFNYSITQTGSPYVDSNLQIKNNGVTVKDIYVDETGTLNMPAGNNFLVEAYCYDASPAADPKLTLIIKKNDSVVFSKTVPATPGESLIYTGTVDVGAVYDINVVAADGLENEAYVNIADTTIVDITEVQVIADQIVRVDKNLDHNSVYLRWIGLTGSWNYYRFTYNQDVSLDVQNATIIKNYVFDWENQDSIEEVISKSAGQKMRVMAEDLSVADIKGLQSIKYSPKVQMLVNKNPVKWQTVVLNTATFAEYETLNGYAPFSITFNLPAINIQTQ